MREKMVGYTIVFSAIVLLAVGVLASGETPGNPLPVTLGEAVEGETARAVFYRLTPTRGGLLVATLKPEGADIDLAIIGPGGNPTVESRRGGLEEEEVSVAVTAGTEYLIRVTSASGRYGRYRLKADFRGASSAAPAAATTGAPAPSGEGLFLPLGRFVPDQTSEAKTYRLHAPGNMSVAVILRPVSGDPSLEVSTSDGTLSGASNRAGGLPEEVEIPAGHTGWFTIQVNPPADGSMARYYIGTDIRVPGASVVQSMQSMVPYGAPAMGDASAAMMNPYAGWGAYPGMNPYAGAAPYGGAWDPSAASAWGANPWAANAGVGMMNPAAGMWGGYGYGAWPGAMDPNAMGAWGGQAPWGQYGAWPGYGYPGYPGWGWR